MKKEVLLAIVSGIVAGLLLALGVWRLTKNVSNNKSIPIMNKPQSSIISNTDTKLSILSPKDMSVSIDETITISGSSKASSKIIASTDANDYLTTLREDGTFTLEILLNGGFNEIKLVSFDLEGLPQFTSLNLVHSSEVENTGESLIYYKGTITDIADKNIQIKSDNNGIKQVTTSDATTYATKEDLAIGDFIIAIGFADGNDVLTTKRILSTDPPGENLNLGLWASVDSIDGKEVSITTPDTKTYSIDFPKTWNGPDISDLVEGQNYIFTGQLDSSTLALRSIFEIE